MSQAVSTSTFLQELTVWHERYTRWQEAGGSSRTELRTLSLAVSTLKQPLKEAMSALQSPEQSVFYRSVAKEIKQTEKTARLSALSGLCKKTHLWHSRYAAWQKSDPKDPQEFQQILADAQTLSPDVQKARSFPEIADLAQTDLDLFAEITQISAPTPAPAADLPAAAAGARSASDSALVAPAANAAATRSERAASDSAVAAAEPRAAAAGPTLLTQAALLANVGATTLTNIGNQVSNWLDANLTYPNESPVPLPHRPISFNNASQLSTLPEGLLFEGVRPTVETMKGFLNSILNISAAIQKQFFFGQLFNSLLKDACPELWSLPLRSPEILERGSHFIVRRLVFFREWAFQADPKARLATIPQLRKVQAELSCLSNYARPPVELLASLSRLNRAIRESIATSLRPGFLPKHAEFQEILVYRLDWTGISESDYFTKPSDEACFLLQQTKGALSKLESNYEIFLRREAKFLQCLTSSSFLEDALKNIF